MSEEIGWLQISTEGFAAFNKARPPGHLVKELVQNGFDALKALPASIVGGPLAAGAANAFAPTPGDRMHPTTFKPGHWRYQCVMVVPADFDGKMRWTLTYGGVTTGTSERMLQSNWNLFEREGGAALAGRGFPTSYFMTISVGAFTKGLGISDLGPNFLALALFIPALTLLSALLLSKQER